MNWSETQAFLAPCMPEELRTALATLHSGELQEIRIRSGQRCLLRTASHTVCIEWTPAERDVGTIAEALCGHGLYTRQAEMRQGYVTLRGGHRLGLCGSVQLQSGAPESLLHLGSLCLRIASEWKGTADPLLPFLLNGKAPQSLLIIGSCGTGKTTLLRDIARLLASHDFRLQVGIVDERGEIGACENGIPQLDLGESSDVLDGCPKEHAFPWLIRSMSPQVIITDELANAADVAAVMDATACGCAVVASVHGTSLSDLAARPVMAALMARRIFSYYVLLSPDGCGQVSAVFDKNGSPARWPQ